MDTRSTRDIFNLIQFKTGFLSPIAHVEDSDETAAALDEGSGAARITPHMVSVTRFEPKLELLPVLSENEPFQLPVGGQVELSVPTGDAIMTIIAEVVQIDKTQQGREVLHLRLNLDEIDVVQRRTDDRFQAKTFTRFEPLPDWKGKADLGIEGVGNGQATDLSLSGMQLSTEFDLPDGYEAFFEIRIPSGTLVVKGRVVRRQFRTRIGSTYGIQFLEYDRITSQRLHQFILSERRKNRERQGHSSRQGGQGGFALERRGRFGRRRREC